MSLYFRQNVEMRTNLFLCCDLKFRFVNNFYLFLNIAILLLFLNLKLLLSSKGRNVTLCARHSARQRSKVPPVKGQRCRPSKIKGAARQCYGDGDGVVCCEWVFTEWRYIRVFVNSQIWQICQICIILIDATGRERLIRSHSSARFCFELSGNSN